MGTASSGGLGLVTAGLAANLLGLSLTRSARTSD
jgi:hypothetical protein